VSKTDKKFYELSVSERMDEVAQLAGLTPEDSGALTGEEGLSLNQADHMIENVVGVYGLPLGVARNFVVNGRPVLVPMVIEEPSVVAGASFMAKLAQPSGGFTATSNPPEMIGQIQLLHVPDMDAGRERLLAAKDQLLAAAAQADAMLVNLGGGPRDMEVRVVDSSPIGPFIVLHLIMDVRDVMGANAVNTALERIAPLAAEICGGKAHLRILSNLADRRLARAACTIRTADLAFDTFSGEQVRDGIIAAWAFAAADPYRAATHNKGIMNGVDAVVMATANDWRAVEAGAHAYAARDGRYTSLSTWSQDEDGNLRGELEMPMAVGIVGGATRVHPAAKAAIKLMGVKTANELAEVIVSVGLAQNLAALRALATEGIQRGHMGLHARQIAIAAGAHGDEVQRLADQLVTEKAIRLDRAQEILTEWKSRTRK
jgi:hydroxymethylglutaryl-CoA reductase